MVYYHARAPSEAGHNWGMLSGDSRMDSRMDSRIDSRMDSRMDSGRDSRIYSRIDSRMDSRIDSWMEHQMARFALHRPIHVKINLSSTSLAHSSPILFVVESNFCANCQLW